MQQLEDGDFKNIVHQLCKDKLKSALPTVLAKIGGPLKPKQDKEDSDRALNRASYKSLKDLQQAWSPTSQDGVPRLSTSASRKRKRQNSGGSYHSLDIGNGKGTQGTQGTPSAAHNNVKAAILGTLDPVELADRFAKSMEPSRTSLEGNVYRYDPDDTWGAGPPEARGLPNFHVGRLRLREGFLSSANLNDVPFDLEVVAVVDAANDVRWYLDFNRHSEVARQIESYRRYDNTGFIKNIKIRPHLIEPCAENGMGQWIEPPFKHIVFCDDIEDRVQDLIPELRGTYDDEAKEKLYKRVVLEMKKKIDRGSSQSPGR